MISVIMPVYNRQTYVAESIDSILNQSYKDFELIIVDDGSTDDTPKLLEFYHNKDERVKVHYLDKNQGIANARNTGISLSKGEYIAVMDSDDLAHPDRLKLSMKAIKKVDFVYSPYLIADEHATVKSVYVPKEKVTFDDVKNNSAWPHVTIMADRVCFIENPYRDYRVNDDAFLVWDWFKAGYKAKMVKEALMIVRMHPGGVSQSKAKEIAKTQEILDKEYANVL
jgi:glycosyltransferase involved in cell wall biosynthesis